jgi:predicted SAM-dependent methyltransferase
VLKPNGIIRIIVPDLKATINKYMQGEIPADEVLDELYVGYDSPNDGRAQAKTSTIYSISP